MPRGLVKKTPRSTWRGQLVSRILLAIFKGEMRGGDRLIEEELAMKLGVSRTPIREALGELASIGVIRIKPNHGAVVRPFGPKQLIEIYQIRRLLEVEATRLAQRNIDPRALQEIRDETQRLADSESHGKRWSEQALDLDERFHDLLSKSAGSERLAQEITRYRALVMTVGDAVGNRLQAHEHNMAEHTAIIDHLLANRPDDAAAAMGKHIDRAAETGAEALGLVYSNPGRDGRT